MFGTQSMLVQAVGAALVHSLWQGAAIAAALWLYLRSSAAGSATSRYAVACCALALMLIAPVVMVLVEVSGRDVVAVMAVADVADVATPGPDASLIEPVATASESHTLDAMARANAWLVSIWFTAVILLLLRLFGGWAVISYRTRRASSSDEWQQRVDDFRRKLSIARPVRVKVDSRFSGPAVIGVFKPCILLPLSVLLNLRSWQVEALILHELAHVRRHDFLVSVAQTLVETLLFYHPLAWWVSGQVRREREYCCDDVAASLAGGRTAYVRALVALEELRPRAAARPVLAASGSSLFDRAIRLLNPEGRRDPVLGSRFVAASVVLLVASTLAIGACDKAGLVDTTPGADLSTDARIPDDSLLVAFGYTRDAFRHLKDSLQQVIDEHGLRADDAPAMQAIIHSTSLRPRYFTLVRAALDRGLVAHALTAWDVAFLNEVLERYSYLREDVSWLPADDPARRSQQRIVAQVATAKRAIEAYEAAARTSGVPRSAAYRVLRIEITAADEFLIEGEHYEGQAFEEELQRLAAIPGTFLELDPHPGAKAATLFDAIKHLSNLPFMGIRFAGEWRSPEEQRFFAPAIQPARWSGSE